MEELTNFLVGYVSTHPKVLAGLVIFIIANTVMKAVVDSIVGSRAQWDKTPDKDETWYEKTLTWAVRVMKVIGKIALYLVGVRSQVKPPVK